MPAQPFCRITHRPVTGNNPAEKSPNKSKDMTKTAEPRNALMEKNRMESITDGIFAFAMTLLVTSMILPGGATTSQSSGSVLISLLP